MILVEVSEDWDGTVKIVGVLLNAMLCEIVTFWSVIP